MSDAFNDKEQGKCLITGPSGSKADVFRRIGSGKRHTNSPFPSESARFHDAIDKLMVRAVHALRPFKGPPVGDGRWRRRLRIAYSATTTDRLPRVADVRAKRQRAPQPL